MQAAVTQNTLRGIRNGLSTPWVAVTAIALLGAALRFTNLGREALWMDEAAAVHFSKGKLLDVVRIVGQYESNPPLFYLLENLFLGVIGDTDRKTRLISALCGTMSIPLIFILLKRVAGASAGVMAASMFTLSWIHIYYSQEARPYAMFLLLAIVSTERFVNLLIDPESKRKNPIGYIIASAAMCYTHYYATYVLLAHAIAVVAAGITNSTVARRFAGRWIICIAIILTIALPLLPHLIKMRNRLSVSPRESAGGAAAQLEAFVTYAGSPWLLLFLIAAALSGLYRSTVPRGLKVLLVAMAVVPVAVPIALSLGPGPGFHHRYGLPAIIGIIGLASIGIAGLPRARNVAAVLFVAAFAWTFWQRQPDFRKPAMRQAAAFVDSRASGGDTVVVSMFYAGFSFDRYSTRADLRRRSYDEFTVRGVVRGQPGMKRLWLVLNQCPVPEESLFAENPMTIVSKTRFYDVDVYELAAIE